MQRNSSLLGLHIIIIFLCASLTIAVEFSNVSLQKRYSLPEWESCFRFIPHDSVNPPRTYFQKIKVDLKDAWNLVDLLLENKEAFKSSTAYSHYFLPIESNQVIKMFQTIRLFLDERDGYHSFSYRCGSDSLPDYCSINANSGTVVAATSPNLGGDVQFCDAMFDSDQPLTENNVTSRAYDNTGAGWCQSTKRYPYFIIAAETVIHELTHLAAVAAVAGLVAQTYVSMNRTFVVIF